MAVEIVMGAFLLVYYLKMAFLVSELELLPWEYHAYFGTQVAFMGMLVGIRRIEIRYLDENERRNGANEELINWRVLKFDGFRSFCFFFDMILGFALFKVHQFFKIAEEAESIWNWGLFSYILYCCFVGGFYIMFVTCDIVTEIKKFRKKAQLAREEAIAAAAAEVARQQAEVR